MLVVSYISPNGLYRGQLDFSFYNSLNVVRNATEHSVRINSHFLYFQVIT